MLAVPWRGSQLQRYTEDFPARSWLQQPARSRVLDLSDQLSCFDLSIAGDVTGVEHRRDRNISCVQTP